jgi:hypothetical protein
MVTAFYTVKCKDTNTIVPDVSEDDIKRHVNQSPALLQVMCLKNSNPNSSSN